MTSYIDWAVSQEFGVMDVNVPAYITHQEVCPMLSLFPDNILTALGFRCIHTCVQRESPSRSNSKTGLLSVGQLPATIRRGEYLRHGCRKRLPWSQGPADQQRYASPGVEHQIIANMIQIARIEYPVLSTLSMAISVPSSQIPTPTSHTGTRRTPASTSPAITRAGRILT